MLECGDVRRSKSNGEKDSHEMSQYSVVEITNLQDENRFVRVQR